MSKAGHQCHTPVTGTVNIGNWGDMPNLGIELGGVEVGCTTDAITGAVTGKVFLVIEKSEDGLTTTSVLKSINFATGVITDPCPRVRHAMTVTGISMSSSPAPMSGSPTHARLVS